MFGMGWPEMGVVAIVAVLVFGPDRLPDLARQAGRFVRTARQMMDKAKNDLADEMGGEFSALRDMDLRDLNPREAVRRHVLSAWDDDDSPSTTPSRPPRADQPAPYDFDAT